MADVLLYSAARAQHVDEVIRPALEAGDVVVCDRYATSTMAYQGYGSGMDRDLLARIGDWVTGGLQPDLVVLLDVSPSDGPGPASGRAMSTSSRAGRTSHATTSTFHQRVREGYLEMAAADPDRWVVLDGSGTIDDVAEEVAAPWMPSSSSQASTTRPGNVVRSSGGLGRRLLHAEDGTGSARLGLGQRRFRRRHQLGAGGAVGGMVHDRGADADVGVADGRQLGDGIAQPQGHDAAGVAGCDDHELVLAEAGHGVEQAHAVGDGAGHVAQHLVGDAGALARR